MKSRFLLVRRSCPHCNQAVKVINKINLKLTIDNQIRIVDCFEWEEFGLKSIPLMEVFSKLGLEEGYPFLYVDGLVIEPAPTTEQLKILLTKFFEGEMI